MKRMSWLRVSASRGDGLRRLLISIAFACGASSIAQSQAHSDADSDRPPQARPTSVLVITVDALRRDHLGAYGYVRPTSPRIDALLPECVVFDNAFTPIARSLPAHVSLWTSAWPQEHGVVAHTGVRNVFASSAKLRSAAELLRDAGLRTTSFVSTRLLGAVGGLSAGFEFVDEPSDSEPGAPENIRTPAEIAARASKWLGFHAESPFLLWTHFAAPAEPNRPDAAHAALFKDDGHGEALVDAIGVAPERFRLGFPPLLTIRMLFPELEGAVSPYPGMQFPEVGRSTFVNLIDRYDADVRAVDDAVGVLLDRLRELKQLDTTLIVFASAHGQSLGERLVLGSGEVTLENLEIPAAIRFPAGAGVAPRRIQGLASIVDVLTTALAATHPSVAAALASQGAGRNLCAAGSEREFVLSQRSKREGVRSDGGPMYLWRSADWTYVRRPELTDYLYDRRADPREVENLAQAQPDRAAELRARTLAAFGLK